jgi:hypothetical protein
MQQRVRVDSARTNAATSDGCCPRYHYGRWRPRKPCQTSKRRHGG